MFFYREAMTYYSSAASAEEYVCVCLCASVANYFYVSPYVCKLRNVHNYVNNSLLRGS